MKFNDYIDAWSLTQGKLNIHNTLVLLQHKGIIEQLICNYIFCIQVDFCSDCAILSSVDHIYIPV